MTMDDVKKWALAHGFRPIGASGMAASYGDLTVSLTFARHEVRSQVSRMGAAVALGSFVPADPLVVQSEARMLEKLGLAQSFVSRFGGKEGRRPVWLDEGAGATLAP